MSDLQTSDILSPEGVVLTSAEQVDRAMAALWEPPAGAANPERSPRTRVCLANVVVFGRSEEASALLETLGELSLNYPSRTIVVLDDDTPEELTGGRVRASVSALCHVAQPGEAQVCCEQILLRTRISDAGDLDHTILPLLESDVPVVIWWTMDPAAHAALFATMRGVSDRLIIDAGVPGFAQLGSTGPGEVRELGWYRIVRWREMVAGMFDECAAGSLDRLDHVLIETSRTNPRAVTHAIWLAAFLGGQLGWAPEGVGAHGCFQLRAAGRRVEVRIHATGTAWHGIKALAVSGGGNAFEVRRREDRPDELRLVVHHEQVCRVPRSMQIPRVSRSDALGQALAGRHVDAAFERALPLAVWMAANQASP